MEAGAIDSRRRLGGLDMINAGMVEQELQQSRAIRIAAEAACCDVEEILEDIERSRPFWQRLVQSHVVETVPLPLAA